MVYGKQEYLNFVCFQWERALQGFCFDGNSLILNGENQVIEWVEFMCSKNNAQQ